MILDGVFVAQMLSPRTLDTFQDYSNSVFLPYIFGQLQSVRRLDIVWDVYLADSLKAGTKSKRGQGQRRKVLPLAPLPYTWKSSLKNDENRSDLFCFLSKQIERTPVSRKILVSTCGDCVVSSSTEIDLTHMSGCTPKRPTREYFFMLHKNIIIRIADTDVVVPAISVVEEIKVEDRWVAFGTGKHFRYTAAHAIASSLSADKSRALPDFTL